MNGIIYHVFNDVFISDMNLHIFMCCLVYEINFQDEDSKISKLLTRVLVLYHEV